VPQVVNAAFSGGVPLRESLMAEPAFDDFERLVRENQRVVYQVAFGMLGNEADAQDIAQDAFVQAYAKRSSLREPEHFRAWVCTIARRLALNSLRSGARARRREESAASAAPTQVDVQELAEERDFLARIRRATDSLPPKLREALVLCAVEGLEPSDVARMLGIPQGTVRSRLHLARKALLRLLS
jgi:RNA polymerase sigma-70 factor (ECF subfamily)